jgi:hypothetical protein
MHKVNITLFKALKPVIIKNDIHNITEYYAKNTVHNYLDHVLGHRNFTTIAIDCDNNSCLGNKVVLEKSCSLLNGRL